MLGVYLSVGLHCEGGGEEGSSTQHTHNSSREQSKLSADGSPGIFSVDQLNTAVNGI